MRFLVHGSCTRVLANACVRWISTRFPRLRPVCAALLIGSANQLSKRPLVSHEHSCASGSHPKGHCTHCSGTMDTNENHVAHGTRRNPLSLSAKARFGLRFSPEKSTPTSLKPHRRTNLKCGQSSRNVLSYEYNEILETQPCRNSVRQGSHNTGTFQDRSPLWIWG